jgi:hypothetical protein
VVNFPLIESDVMLVDNRVTENDEFVFLLHTTTDDQMTPQVHMGPDSSLTVIGTWRNEYGAIYLVAVINTHSNHEFIGRHVRFLDRPKPEISPKVDLPEVWKPLRPFVYIAAPFTIGDNALNIRNAMDAAEQVLVCDALPFNPLLMNAHYVVHHRDWRQAMQICFSYLAKCDLVWRITGPSKGADEECTLANHLGIRVLTDFYDLRFAIKDFQNGRPKRPVGKTRSVDDTTRCSVNVTSDGMTAD